MIRLTERNHLGIFRIASPLPVASLFGLHRYRHVTSLGSVWTGMKHEQAGVAASF
jgi:hypothetical protein